MKINDRLTRLGCLRSNHFRLSHICVGQWGLCQPERLRHLQFSPPHILHFPVLFTFDLIFLTSFLYLLWISLISFPFFPLLFPFSFLLLPSLLFLFTQHERFPIFFLHQWPSAHASVLSQCSQPQERKKEMWPNCYHRQTFRYTSTIFRTHAFTHRPHH